MLVGMDCCLAIPSLRPIQPRAAKANVPLDLVHVSKYLHEAPKGSSCALDWPLNIRLVPGAVDFICNGFKLQDVLANPCHKGPISQGTPATFIQKIIATKNPITPTMLQRTIGPRNPQPKATPTPKQAKEQQCKLNRHHTTNAYKNATKVGMTYPYRKIHIFPYRYACDFFP